MKRALTEKLDKLQVAACQKMLGYMFSVNLRPTKINTNVEFKTVLTIILTVVSIPLHRMYTQLMSDPSRCQFISALQR